MNFFGAKRILLVFGCCIAFLPGIAFANVEMDLNVYMSPSHSYGVTETPGDHAIPLVNSMKSNIAGGTEMQWGFFIGHPAKIIDIGINLSYGVDLFKKFDFNGRAVNGIAGANFYGALGPVLRITPFGWLSFYVSPCIGVNTSAFFYDPVDGNGDEPDFILIVTPEIDLDLGARFWLVRKQNFHFGIDAGADLIWDFKGGIGIDNYNGEYSVNNGFTTNIYVGVCFNFGETSYTHFSGQ